jgi:thiol-disulfide isomerase/thioredoxin
MRCLLLFYFLCISSFLFSNNTKWITGTLSNKSDSNHLNRSVYLYKYGFKGEMILIDSSKIDINGHFSYGKNHINFSTMFCIVYEDSRIEFISSPNDKLSIVLDSNFESIKGSLENDIYITLKQIEEENNMYFLESQDKARSLSIFDPKFSKKMKDIRDEYFSKIAENNKRIKNLQKSNPKLYASEVIAPLYYESIKNEVEKFDEQYDSHIAFWHVHFFDYINFDDERILISKKLFDKIEKYFDSFIEKDTFEGVMFGLDLLFSKIEKEMVRKYIIYFLLEYFKNEKLIEAEAYLNSILTELEGCEMEDLFDLDEKKVITPSLTIGKIAPNIILNDINDAPVELYSLKGNEKILLVFWASWCNHCIEMLDDLESLYINAQNNTQFYSVSLDHSREEWKLFFKNKKLFPWKNVCDGNGLYSDLIKTFQLKVTPTFFVLDADFMVSFKTNNLDEVKKVILEKE